MKNSKIKATLLMFAVLWCGVAAVSACTVSVQSAGNAAESNSAELNNGVSGKEPADEVSADGWYGEAGENNHIHSSVHTAAENATCTVAGNIEYWFCIGCGKYFSDGECKNEIPKSEVFIPAEHVPVTDAAIEADCKGTGLTEGCHCGVCGEVLTAQQVVERLEHNFVNGVCSVCGEWQESDGLEYERCGDGYAVVGVGNCKAEKIRIPEKYEGLPIVKIEEFAFYENENIIGLLLPDSIEHIGIYAFEGCLNLECVYFGGSITEIGESAFAGCINLKKAEQMSKLQILADGAFSGCISLTEIELPASAEFLGNYAFAYCTGLEKITLHAGVREFGSYLFYGCGNLDEIVFDGTAEEWADIIKLPYWDLSAGDYDVHYCCV